jgi:hypothetical protein
VLALDEDVDDLLFVIPEALGVVGGDIEAVAFIWTDGAWFGTSRRALLQYWWCATGR